MKHQQRFTGIEDPSTGDKVRESLNSIQNFEKIERNKQMEVTNSSRGRFIDEQGNLVSNTIDLTQSQTARYQNRNIDKKTLLNSVQR